jgi:threonine synthase
VRYCSTRGAAPVLDFSDVLLEGLATDGGLYVPEVWPALTRPTSSSGPNGSPGEVGPPSRPGSSSRSGGSPGQARFLPRYTDLAVEVMWPFVDGCIELGRFAEIVAEAYATFDVDSVVPVVPLGHGVWVAELFHGPTLAFKDIALQLVGRLFDEELGRRGERATIVGATSGDTGSAAIEGCRGRDHLDIFILHPDGRTSEVQRRQMTTVDAPNVHNLAIDGTFDDCQDLVKALFSDEGFRRDHHLAAVNSINWARVMAQIVYYVSTAAAVAPDGGPVAFSVPTGNFGNVYAGYAARQMGLSVDQLIVASNRNDILTRFFTTGVMEIHEVHPTLSPSMDIQVSSNLERLLFDLLDRDGRRLAGMLEEFRRSGRVEVTAAQREWLAAQMSAGELNDDGCLAQIAATHRNSGYLLDPHTAVGVAVGERLRRSPEVPLVCLATAHPAKFPDAVEVATGVRPALPDRLADLFERPERYDRLPNDLDTVRRYIAERSAAR